MSGVGEGVQGYQVARFGRDWVASLAAMGLVALPLLATVLAPLGLPCVVRQSIGLPCPGCGLGRALCALLDVDPVAAVAAYPPLPLLGGAYLLTLVVTAGRAMGRPLRWRVLGQLLGYALAAAVVGNWLVQLARHLG